MAVIQLGYEIEGTGKVFNTKAVESVDCNYINWTSNTADSTFINSRQLKYVTNLNPNITTMFKTFEGCSNFTSLDAFPPNVVNMESAFQNCTSLTLLPDIPNTVTRMVNTFRNCTNMTSIPTIPESVTNLMYAFSDCTSLKYAINIGTSAVSMSGAFRNCTNLMRVGTLPSTLQYMTGTFYNCPNLTSSPALPNTVLNLGSTYQHCTALVAAPVIPNNVRNMQSTFADCTKLINAPTLPNSITELDSTFSGCSNLTNAGTIPSSITNLHNTYTACTSLVNMPGIPPSVTTMESTFEGCINLANIQSIPPSVTSMYRTFKGCTSFVNDIIIASKEITNAVECFADTTAMKNVFISFNYADSTERTKTYNAFIAAGYQEDGSVNGVRLRNVDVANVTIRQVPTDAIVTLNATGYTQGLNTITVKKGTPVSYKVERYGYEPVPSSGMITVTPTTDQVIDVALTKTNFTITIETDQPDVTIEFTVGSTTTTASSISVPYETVVNWKASKSGYFTQTGSIEADQDQTLILTMIKTHYTVTINPVPSDATVTLTCGSTTTTNHSIVAPYMGSVHWKVEKEGYNTREGDITDIQHDTIEEIILVDPSAEIYINSNTPITSTWTVPKDGIYEIIAVGAGGGGSTSSVNIKHRKYTGLLSHLRAKYTYEQAVMSASGGSGAMSRTYYRFKRGQVFEYRIGAGGAKAHTTADNAGVLRAGDGQSTYLADLVVAGGGTGGLTKASDSSAIREAGTGGTPAQTGYMSLKQAVNGKIGSTKTNSETAVGGASVYSNYGAGGDAQGTVEGSTSVKNGGNGYLKITLIANDPLYERNTSGQEPVTINYPGVYDITIVGAGGGGQYSWATAIAFRANGGSGGLITGQTRLTAGTYTAKVGAGGAGHGGFNWHTGDDGGKSSFGENIAYGGKGAARTEGGAGGSTEIKNTGLTGSPGVKGDTTNRYGNYGGGGAGIYGLGDYNSHAYPGNSGYIKISWVGE